MAGGGLHDLSAFGICAFDEDPIGPAMFAIAAFPDVSVHTLKSVSHLLKVFKPAGKFLGL